MIKLSHFLYKDLELTHVLLDISTETEMSMYFSLFQACFGKRPNISDEAFKWLNYKLCGTENYNFGFLHNGKLIAAYGLLPSDIRVNSKILKAALCTNVMTDPEYAGKGLFSKIGELSIQYIKVKGISLCVGIPNENAIKGHLNIGWQKFQNIDFFEISKKDYPNNLNSNAEIFAIDKFNFRDFEFDVFFDNKYDFHFLRNSNWLNWRTSKPNTMYEKFFIKSCDTVQGYMILKKYIDVQANIKKLHIVDYAYSSILFFEQLINHAIIFALKNEFDLINIWNFELDIHKTGVLSKAGFNKSNSSNYVILYPLQNDIQIENIKNMHLTLFDNDVY